mgnify:CR=1 FL=1
MKTIIRVLFILLFHFNISAQQNDIPFKKGEKLQYKIHYGPITAGIANLEIETLPNKFKFIANGQSNRLFSLFFEVKDFYESIVDKKSLHPNQFYRNVKEGGYKKIENVFFNHKLNQAETTRDTIPLPENPQDILSMFYYLRTIQLMNENILAFDYFNGKKKINYKLIVSGKEEIKSKIGSFNCYIVKPFHQGKSLLKNEGDMKIWISDSEKRLPIKIQIKMKFGSMKLDLISVN